jgi:hypothetical protein
MSSNCIPKLLLVRTCSNATTLRSCFVGFVKERHRKQVCEPETPTLVSRQSRKLQSFSGRASTAGVSSRMIFARSFWLTVVYHFESRTLPCRLSSSTKRICGQTGNPP